MSVLSARDLGFIRDTVEGYSMPDTAVILTNQPTRDGGAGQNENWVASGTVSCRVREELSPREVEVGASTRMVVPVPVSLPYGCGVTHENRLVIGGGTVEIIGNDDTRSEAGALHVLAVRMS